MLAIGVVYAVDEKAHLLPFETNISNFFKPHSGDLLESKELKNIDCIYVLNLDERSEKWHYTNSILAKYGITYNRFSGITGWKFTDEEWAEIKKLYSNKCNLQKGKVGCILSHLSIIQDAYDRGFENIWILQDDIDILRDPKLIDEYVDQLSEIDPKWDLLYTDLDMRQYENPEKPLKALCITGATRDNQKPHSESWYLQRYNINEDFQRIRLRYGFHSVILSRRSMEKILYYFKHVELQTCFDIDVDFVPEINQYGLRDPIIVNSSNWLISDSSKEMREIHQLEFPYNTLDKILPFNPHGWFAESNAKKIEEILKERRPKVVFELGSWLGKSTIFIANRLDFDAKLYAVDHWKGSTEHYLPHRKSIHEMLPTLYEQFLSNVVQKRVSDKIIPWRMNTEEAASRAYDENISIDFLYIDASHDEQSVYEDLCHWYPLVKEGGVICGDDWGWSNPMKSSSKRKVYLRRDRLTNDNNEPEFPVQAAVRRFANDYNVSFEVDHYMYIIYK